MKLAIAIVRHLLTSLAVHGNRIRTRYYYFVSDLRLGHCLRWNQDGKIG